MARPTWSKSLAVGLWPPVDHAAWQAALKPGDVFEPGGVASRWSAATQHKTALGYGRYLFWLQEHGNLDVTLAPAGRVDRDLVRAYLEELKLSNRGHTLHNRIQELGNAMRALAPEDDWRWLLRAASRLRVMTIPAQDKRARLRPVADLVAQGFRMMDEADQGQGCSELGRAAYYRDGMVMAFLGSHPLRLRNLASLRLDHHLIKEGEEFLLKLVAAETKGRRRPYEAVIAQPLAEAIRQYLDRYRPVLLKARGRWHSAAGDALWISRDGSPCREETFANIIRKHTRGSDGRPLSPHLFRSCAATSIAINAPGSVDIIPAILGHASPTTGERYYNLATSLEASRAHNTTLDRLEKDLARKSR
jgi:integrase/recombinase XerD